MTLGSDAVTFFTRRLRRAGSAARAAGEKAYLKSDLDFFGTDLPTIRASARAFKRAHPELTHDELLSLVQALWGTTSHELRSVGIAVLDHPGNFRSPVHWHVRDYGLMTTNCFGDSTFAGP